MDSSVTPRTRKTSSKKPAVAQQVAASFEYSTAGAGGLKLPIWIAPKGGRTMIDMQKFRNNYYTMDGRDQASICRRMVERSWFLRHVIPLRHACQTDGFRAVDSDSLSMEEQYDFASLVSDVMWEDLITSNVVCMWRKGQKLPVITVLDMETVAYECHGGIERIVVQYSQDSVMAKDEVNKASYIEALGEKVYEAATKGKKVTIIKGFDEDWDFEVLTSGKRRGVFCIPEPVHILDTLDFIELMGVGDWNLAWFRKDVIRRLKKGYKVTQGQGAGVNSVDITDQEIETLGKGSANINGNANIPMNHDVEMDYLTIGPDNFKPDQVETAMDRLLLYGGIEAVVLFGSFSQQNGAAPSLMRNARTMAAARRARVENLLRRIFLADEFKSLKWGDKGMKFQWGVKSLYSLDELLSLVKGTNDGTASPQTRRSWLDLDNEVEAQNLKAAHADREGYAPPFEAGQALLPAMFPEELVMPSSVAPSAKAPAEPAGRPKKVK